MTDIFNTNKKWDIIYADPPWRYNDRRCNGACENHYDTMRLGEIKNLPIADICEKDCVLFLWATYPMLKEALQVMEAWGNTEPCLLAVKGKPKRQNNSVSQIIECPLGRHSAKPLMARDKIKALMGDNTKCLELFAREQVEGWDCWGKEVV